MFVAYFIASSCNSLLNKGNKKWFKYSACVITTKMVLVGTALCIKWLGAAYQKHRNNKKNHTHVNKTS
jgi:hypothetical protein